MGEQSNRTQRSKRHSANNVTFGVGHSGLRGLEVCIVGQRFQESQSKCKCRGNVADFSRKCSIGIHTDSGRLDRSQTCFDEEHVRQQRDRNGRWALFGTRQT